MSVTETAGGNLPPAEKAEPAENVGPCAQKCAKPVHRPQKQVQAFFDQDAEISQFTLPSRARSR